MRSQRRGFGLTGHRDAPVFTGSGRGPQLLGLREAEALASELRPTSSAGTSSLLWALWQMFMEPQPRRRP